MCLSSGETQTALTRQSVFEQHIRRRSSELEHTYPADGTDATSRTKLTAHSKSTLFRGQR